MMSKNNSTMSKRVRFGVFSLVLLGLLNSALAVWCIFAEGPVSNATISACLGVCLSLLAILVFLKFAEVFKW